eukprot:TRINITY_DN14625_c0_g1_i1.p1 TRINITY_DN14625_c0_g1~~TRINITY_DN14625_c0_g1_i1.p1  ORF type:complete len:253 (+),score=16.91 TRINITY_DN14625_c0_g1_i1:183-941(+)
MNIFARRISHLTSQVACQGLHVTIRTVLVVPVAQVSHLLNHQANAEQIYSDHPIAFTAASKRGRLLEDFSRSIMADLYPNAIFEDAGKDAMAKGIRSGWTQAEYDWKQDGRRVECKSSMLSWQKPQKRWGFRAANVKLKWLSIRPQALFDDLILTLYTPAGFFVYSHDLKLGVSTQGKQTATLGHRIRLSGSKNVLCWAEALDGILNKLDSDTNDCYRIAHVPLYYTMCGPRQWLISCSRHHTTLYVLLWLR